LHEGRVDGLLLPPFARIDATLLGPDDVQPYRLRARC
jgi:hypothetical protein